MRGAVSERDRRCGGGAVLRRRVKTVAAKVFCDMCGKEIKKKDLFVCLHVRPKIMWDLKAVPSGWMDESDKEICYDCSRTALAFLRGSVEDE